MSVAFSSLVNQKLAFARALCAQAALFEQNPLLKSACTESASFQLCAGFSLYLREVAGVYGLPDEPYPSAVELQAAFEARGRISPEANELSGLQGRGNTWLNHMLECYRQVVDPLLKSQPEQGINAAPGATGSVQVIDSVEIKASDLSVYNLEECLRKLQELITRQRESMLEC